MIVIFIFMNINILFYCYSEAASSVLSFSLVFGLLYIFPHNLVSAFDSDESMFLMYGDIEADKAIYCVDCMDNKSGLIYMEMRNATLLVCKE